MFWIYIGCSVIALGLVLAVLADRLQRRFLRSRLNRYLGPKRALVQSHPIIAFTSEDLGSGKPLGRLGLRGFLLIDQHGVRIVCMSRAAKPLISEVGVAADSVEMGWIPVNSLTLGMTSLIRLRSDSGFIYFAARSRLGSPGRRGTMQLKELLARRYRCKLVDTPPAHLLGVGLKVGLALTLATSLVAVLFAFRSADLLGPEILAGRDDRLAVASKSELIVMNSDGGVLRRLSLPQLGVKGRLTELKWAGENVLYLGIAETGSILRCEIDPGNCRQLPKLERAALDLLGAFSFALDLEQQRIYLADSGNHRVLVLDLDGGLISEFEGAARKFCFPNTLRMAEDNSHFYLSDTNNFRLAAFSMIGGQPAAVPQLEDHLFVSRLPAEYGCRHDRGPKFHDKWLDRAADFSLTGRPSAIPTVRSDRVWGFDTLRDNSGRWWVILGDGNLRRGDLLRLEADWTRPVRVELAAGADPASLALLGQQLLVADPLRPAIYQVDTDNLQVTEFGSSAYRAELQAIAHGQHKARMFYYSSLGLALFFLFVVLLLAVINQRSQLRRILAAEG